MQQRIQICRRCPKDYSAAFAALESTALRAPKNGSRIAMGRDAQASSGDEVSQEVSCSRCCEIRTTRREGGLFVQNKNLKSQIPNKPGSKAHEAHCVFQIGCENNILCRCAFLCRCTLSMCIFVSMYSVVSSRCAFSACSVRLNFIA